MVLICFECLLYFSFGHQAKQKNTLKFVRGYFFLVHFVLPPTCGHKKVFGQTKQNAVFGKPNPKSVSFLLQFVLRPTPIIFCFPTKASNLSTNTFLTFFLFTTFMSNFKIYFRKLALAASRITYSVRLHR